MSAVIQFAIFFVGFIVSTLFNLPVIAALSAVFAFAGFDALGYFQMHTKVPPEESKESLISYRAIQVAFQSTIVVILYNMGPHYAIAFMIAWWYGVCDILYYLILKQDFTKYGNMFWLWWTPQGLINKIIKESDISPTTAIVQAIIGALIFFIVVFQVKIF